MFMPNEQKCVGISYFGSPDEITSGHAFVGPLTILTGYQWGALSILREGSGRT